MAEQRDEIKVDKESLQAGYDAHEANLKPVIIIGVSSVILLVLSIILIDQYFIATKERLVEEMVLSPQSTALRELRAREEEALNSYRVIDAEKGIYQIPIDRAMELIANEAYRSQQTSLREQ
jgi:hypothetical protein